MASHLLVPLLRHTKQSRCLQTQGIDAPDDVLPIDIVKTCGVLFFGVSEARRSSDEGIPEFRRADALRRTVSYSGECGPAERAAERHGSANVMT